MRLKPEDYDRIADDMLALMDASIGTRNPSDQATAFVEIVGRCNSKLITFARACDKSQGGNHIEQQYKDGLKKHINRKAGGDQSG